MGMITARRMRDRMAEEAASGPPPEPRPEYILTREHDRIVSALHAKHGAEIAALRAQLVPQPARHEPRPAAKTEEPKASAPEAAPTDETHGRGKRSGK